MLIGLPLAILVVAVPLAWLIAIVFALVAAARRAGRDAGGQAIAWAALGGLLAVSPWLLWDGANIVLREQAKAERVPAPLRVERTEYALEDNFGGIGLPGDNETGFVVYRLTPESSALLRRSAVNSFKWSNFGNWKSTPVSVAGEGNSWRQRSRDPNRVGPRLAATAAYLGRYGFSIPVEPARLRELDRVVNASGAFYATGGGGSVTVVDPRHGRVYFIYAG